MDYVERAITLRGVRDNPNQFVHLAMGGAIIYTDGFEHALAQVQWYTSEGEAKRFYRALLATGDAVKIGADLTIVLEAFADDIADFLSGSRHIIVYKESRDNGCVSVVPMPGISEYLKDVR